MRRKGFTLVELLVVIAIIALLMGILMPALSRARQLAFRLTCGTNLSGIGKAMMVYAHDYDGKLPRAGGRSSTWGPVRRWSAPDRGSAFGLTLADSARTGSFASPYCRTGGGSSSNTASINSCFYLLVKYAEVTPKSFVCKSDAGTGEFRLSDLPVGTVPATFELADAWDFGPEPFKHCSYSYQIPFGSYALTTSGEPGLAVAADRNPWIRSPAADPQPFARFEPELQPWRGTDVQARAGNAVAHQAEGQNVLFLDSHVRFEKRAYCSLEDDNIFTVSDYPDKGSPLGAMPVAPTASPANKNDSILVHDPPEFGGGSAAAGVSGHH